MSNLSPQIRLTAASEVKLAYSASGTDNQKPKSSTGSGFAGDITDQVVKNTIAPVEKSIEVTGTKQITLTYDANISASNINTTNSKAQYSIKIDDGSPQNILSISIVDKTVVFVIGASMSAASNVYVFL